MRITSLNIPYNIRTTVNKNLSFGTVERNVYNTDNFSVKYKNNTCLLRSDLNWNMFARYVKSLKTPQTIYCYACSDGSEAYSIALALINKLGYKAAQKHFPIIAKDIDEVMIKRAQKNIVALREQDLDRLSLLKNLKAEDYFKKTDFKDYENKDCNGYNDFYKITEKLRKCVKFEKGDIVKDLGNAQYKNSIVFFRNALPYLSHGDRKILINNIKKNFTPTTSFIVGSFDKAFWENETGDSQSFDDFLFEAGLWQVKPMIYGMHDLTNNPLNLNNWRKIFCNNVNIFVLNVLEMFRPLVI